ncbi:alpha-L-fucosidase [Labilibacter marinus]|uniref:alpha-L-fucosidase n=1 Tax=Labilibacter marinus TaxID=1477105 RepID=UPI00094FC72E|nr:alpha-L-fucosidase [Labilibacter marinus]
MKKSISGLCLMMLLALMACNTPNPKQIPEATPYEANWESLSKHQQSPEWFADAKLGIYFHWGLYSVPAYGNEWYPSNMYQEGHDVMKHHKETWGDPKDFNYHDFVPMFKAEHFDAKDWVQLFKDAGAKFGGPCAQHHDGYAMWDSKVNPWNVVNRGPGKDITGEMMKELKANGLKTIATFHHARNLQRFKDRPDYWGANDSHYAYNPAWATSSTDPDTAKLYGNIPAEEFHQYWFAQLKEVIDQYSPDIIWFDSWLNLIPEQYRQEFAAYYLNEAKKTNQDVVIAYKQYDMPSSVGVLDIEQGGKKDLSESVWLTDVTLSHGSWCYTEGQTYKTADMVVRNMIDVWSKNGVVLLNISPKANGIIPEEQRTVLHEIGAWMKEFGQAVYNTRPYYIYGFGNAKVSDGHFGGQSASTEYTADDFRFLQSKDGKTIYMFMLGKPEVGKTIETMKLIPCHFMPATPIKRISVMGSDVEVDWKMGKRVFEFTIPDAPMNDIATVFKIEVE